MQKIPCSVIRDLLVLYEDGVCSEETKQMIEEHIAGCGECREIYEKTAQDLPGITVNPEEPDLIKEALDGFKEDRTRMKEEAAEQWKIIEKAFRKLQIKLGIRVLIVAGVVMLVLLSGIIFWRDFLEEKINKVEYEDLKVTEMYELSNGDIYCTFETKEKFLDVMSDTIQTPEGKKWKDYDDAWHQIYFQYPHFYEKKALKSLLKDKVSIVFQRREKVRSTEESEIATHEVKTIYYNRKGGKDEAVIWKEGQKLPKAPAELEEKVRQVMGERNEYEGVEYWQFVPVEMYEKQLTE